MTPGVTPPIGKNVLQLHNIQETENYTCVAASKLGIIEATTIVRVQGMFPKGKLASSFSQVAQITVTSFSHPSLASASRERQDLGRNSNICATLVVISGIAH